MKRTTAAAVAVATLRLATGPALAECRWMLWGQDERYWGKGWRLLT